MKKLIFLIIFIFINFKSENKVLNFVFENKIFTFINFLNLFNKKNNNLLLKYNSKGKTLPLNFLFTILNLCINWKKDSKIKKLFKIGIFTSSTIYRFR